MSVVIIDLEYGNIQESYLTDYVYYVRVAFGTPPEIAEHLATNLPCVERSATRRCINVCHL